MSLEISDISCIPQSKVSSTYSGKVTNLLSHSKWLSYTKLRAKLKLEKFRFAANFALTILRDLTSLTRFSMELLSDAFRVGLSTLLASRMLMAISSNQT